MEECDSVFPGLKNQPNPTREELLAENAELGGGIGYDGENNPNYRHGRRVGNAYDKTYYEKNKHHYLPGGKYYKKSKTTDRREYYLNNKDKWKDADGRWSANVRAGTAAAI